MSYFKDGFVHALDGGTVFECPVPLKSVGARGAWLDGFGAGEAKKADRQSLWQPAFGGEPVDGRKVR